jgi:hypothetical protein
VSELRRAALRLAFVHAAARQWSVVGTETSTRGVKPRVILVDGKKLAQLMIDHDVGVTTCRPHLLKRLDLDDFPEGDEAEATEAPPAPLPHAAAPETVNVRVEGPNQQ